MKEDSVYILRLLRAADVLLPRLVQQMETSGKFSPPLSLRYRVKKEGTINEKLVRKRARKPTYSFSDLGDIVGIRIVTMLRQDIATVADAILSLIGSADAVPTGPFGNARVVEFRQFISGIAGIVDPETDKFVDPLSDSLREVCQQHFGDDSLFSVELRARYSSVHILLRIQFSHEDTEYSIPIEIQIRSIFEDAWGELDHKLFYEADRTGLLAGQRQRMAAARHLGVLKNLLDTAADYAAIISEMDFGASREPAPELAKTLDELGFIEELCRPLKEHSDILSEFMALMKEKEGVDAATDDAATNLSAYAVLAEEFGDLVPRLRAALNTDQAEASDPSGRIETIICLARMEESLCRLLTGNKVQIHRATTSYRAIVAEYPSYPTGWFRLAQACAQLMDKCDSESERDDLCSESVACYDKSEEALTGERAGGLIVSPSQASYIDDNVARLKGFVLWRCSDLRRRERGQADSRDLQLLNKAWRTASAKVADPAGMSPRASLALLNSALYFGVDLRSVATNVKSKNLSLPAAEDLRALLSQLKLLVEEQESQSMRVWHTLLLAYRDLEPEVDLTSIAKEIARMHAEASLTAASDYEREAHERAFGAAWEILNSKLANL